MLLHINKQYPFQIANRSKTDFNFSVLINRASNLQPDPTYEHAIKRIGAFEHQVK